MSNWYDMNSKDVLRQLQVDPDKGLSKDTVVNNQQKYGKNEYEKGKKDSLLKSILQQLRDVSTIILVLAAVLSFALALRSEESFLEPIVILAIVIMNVVLAISQERSAEKALEALANLNSPSCMVLRDGNQQEIATSEVVVGDIIMLKTGSLVPADARLIQSVNLQVDESSLTGESENSEKDSQLLLEGKVPIGDQQNMVFSGCLVTAGRASAVVTSTGMETQMGKIAGYLNNTQKIRTPLQKRLDKLGKAISFIAIISAIFLFMVGIVNGEDFWSMVLLGVTLAVAAVPETLALIVTLSLTRGVQNMVKKNTLIRKLPAVETLGNTSVICSDKTGTLTQNQMTVKRLYVKNGEPFPASAEFDDVKIDFLKMLSLVCNATVKFSDDGGFEIIGDPTESAIVSILTEKGIKKGELEKEYQRTAEIPFSSDRKMMTTVVKDPKGGYIVLTKGAIDRIPLKNKIQISNQLNEVHDSFAKDALRVIALGMKHIDKLPEEIVPETLEFDLEFLGFVGLIDPPRPEATKAIARAKKAGIRTVMITGDHAITAEAIAKDIGILTEYQKVMTGAELSEMSDEELFSTISDYSVYARVSPEDKIRIVEAWQENGEVVAMTGDGVNDAPALNAADVGIAMGKTGTEVAKSASDIVLTDDNFATIVDAVHEGRNVYSNTRKTIYFLLVCNLSEVAVMIIAQLRGWGMLVTPVMLLLINVIGDGIPGLNISREVSDPRIMENDPVKRDESFFSGGMLRVIIWQTVACSIVVLIGYYFGAFVPLSPAFEPSAIIGQTMGFLVIGWTSILHIFTVRSRKSIFKRTLKDNPPLSISAAAMIILFAGLVAIKPLGNIFGLTNISISHWMIVIALSIVPTIVAEIGKVVDNRRFKKEVEECKNRIVHKRKREQGDVV